MICNTMRQSILSHLIDPLREMLYQFDMVIRGFRERMGGRIAGLSCWMLPPEIPASAGMVPLRLPFFGRGVCPCLGISEIDEIYDCLVVPQGCAGRASVRLPVYEFDAPGGYGMESAGLMEEAMDRFLRSFGLPRVRDLNAGRLLAAAQEYNALRRLVRGIASIRRSKPDLLSCKDLADVFEASAVLPPEAVIGHLVRILDEINKARSCYNGGMKQALAYGSFINDASILDEIEEAGCIFVEDDFCSGRRQFDMSYDEHAESLLREILGSFSYRPGCASFRTVGERTKLFYSMMKNEGIELVVFLEDLCCASKKGEIGELRVKLMRSGVDPLVAVTADAAEKVREYAGRS
jgi:benzoyl-CoA reductase/2-hydroxyglutaryl-CoA dehydratase subunit BcrC/BadD/HgdB